MTWRRLLATAVLLASAGGAFAQTPAAPPQLDVATTPRSQFLASATLDGRGNVTLLWSQLHENGVEERARWRRFGPFGPLAPDAVLTARRSFANEVVSNRRGDVIAIWNELLPDGTTQGALRRISRTNPTLDLRFNHQVDDVDISASGFFMVVWTAATPAGNRVMAQMFDFATGRPGPQFTVSTPSPGGEGGGSVAMSPRSDSVVIWSAKNADGSFRGIFGRRANFFGPQGSEFQVNTTPIGDATRFAYEVGRANDGSFVVAWSRKLNDELSTDVFAQRFNAAGEKAGGEIAVAEDSPVTDGYVRLAVAPEGHFATAWDDGAPPLFLRLYRKDGTPVSPAREIVERTTPFPGAPQLDFGHNGTFVLAWNDFIGIHDPDDDNAEVNYQLFAASPGTELCLFRNGHFRCDTSGGGGFEIDHAFDVQSGVPLLGDVDGDGRDDFCMFRGTRFDCDSGHDYGAAETTITFGQPGDTPLLGDVDGDGRDEACVFRTGLFLCDTGHDGGAAETTIAFSEAGDRALLGDVDGDGRDNACVSRDNQFLCDTAGDGGTAETVRILGPRGPNVTLLGDVNDDGRDDACYFGVFGVGVFTCNIGDDGIQVHVTGVGRPLIGNVDGL